MHDRFDDTKQRFHIVQLALFNAEVLSASQREADTNPHGACAKLIDQCARKTIASFPPAPCTINQSVFFGMAYLSIVWLSESLTLGQVKEASNAATIGEIFSNAKVSGPRKLNDGADFIRLIRNALSHGKVSVDDEFCFTFWDQDERKQKGGGKLENDPTSLLLESEVLGALINAYYEAVSTIIYKD